LFPTTLFVRFLAAGGPRPTARRCHLPENQKAQALPVHTCVLKNNPSPSPKSSFSFFFYFLPFLYDSNVIIAQ
jgi:hypothetical protein